MRRKIDKMTLAASFCGATSMNTGCDHQEMTKCPPENISCMNCSMEDVSRRSISSWLEAVKTTQRFEGYLLEGEEGLSNGDD